MTNDRYIVVCTDDGVYYLATRRIFATRDTAEAYARTVNPSRACRWSSTAAFTSFAKTPALEPPLDLERLPHLHASTGTRTGTPYALPSARLRPRRRLPFAARRATFEPTGSPPAATA